MPLQCTNCAYDLSGLPRTGSKIRCPECGLLFDPRFTLADRVLHRRWPGVPFVAAQLALPGIIGFGVALAAHWSSSARLQRSALSYGILIGLFGSVALCAWLIHRYLGLPEHEGRAKLILFLAVAINTTILIGAIWVWTFALR